MTSIDDPDMVDYTTRPLGEVTDGGRIEVCPACGLVGLAVRYHGVGRGHPARYVHRRPAYSAEYPRVQQHQLWEASRQSDTTNSCYVDPAPRADGLPHDSAAAVITWAAIMRHLLIQAESAVNLGWFDHVEGHTVEDRLTALRPFMATSLSEIQAILREGVDDGR